MTKKKRFIEIEDEWIKDIETGDEWEYAIECMPILNYLIEENKELKKHNKRLHQDLHKINTIARGY